MILDRIMTDHDRALTDDSELDFNYEVLEADYSPTAPRLRRFLDRKKLMNAATSFFKRHGVDVVVLFSDTRMEEYRIVLAAKALGLPTVLIPDGFVLPETPGYRRPLLSQIKLHTVAKWFETRRPRGTSGVDRILMMNRSGQGDFDSVGVGNRVRTIGSAEYDELFERTIETDRTSHQRELRLKYGLPTDKKILVFAHQMAADQEQINDLILKLAAIARSLDILLLVKLHPRTSDDPDKWQQKLKTRGLDQHAVFMKNDVTSIDAVWMADACVTVVSTMGLEAMITGIGLLIIKYIPSPRLLSYHKDYGAVVDVESEEDLADHIDRIINDEDYIADINQKALVALRTDIFIGESSSIRRTIDEVCKIADAL